VRVGRHGRYHLLSAGQRLDPTSTLSSQAMAPLDRVDLVWARQEPA
jgi:hypothetical protein